MPGTYISPAETGLYYLQSRYYDPEIGRFINADNYPSTGQGLTGNNMFAYCGNNPIVKSDPDGQAWETAWDVLSFAGSVVDVAANPTDIWAWVGLAGDAADILIPFVGGIGETTRAMKAMTTTAEVLDDLHDTRKVTSNAPVIIGETMDRVNDYAKQVGGITFTNVDSSWSPTELMEQNRAWLREMMDEGKAIIDIGPDFSKRRLTGTYSQYYAMERTELVGYPYYQQVFTRYGQYGGLPGEW